MATLPRVHEPATGTWPEGVSPLTSRTQGNKVEIRATGGRGVSWEEEYTWLQGRDGDVRELLQELMQWHASGTTVDLTPYSHRAALGTVVADATGQIDGAAQSGATLDVDNFSPASGTILQGDYITITGSGPGHALWITADTTLSSGAGTLNIYPSIPTGQEPSDSGTVTLNGVITCEIVDPPRMPVGRPALNPSGSGITEIWSSTRVRYREAV